MKNVIQIIVIIMLAVLPLKTYSDTAKTTKDDIDVDSDLKAIEKELQKLEEKVKKQEEEEKDIDVIKEMNKVERLMREIHKEFTAVGGGEKSKEIIAKLKKIEEKMHNIISHISFTIHPIVKKENDTINILEKIIKNWRFSMSKSQNQSKQKDQKHEMSKKQLQKLLAQLKKQREKERRGKSKPTAQQPATSAYDVPPTNYDTAEVESKGGIGIRWGDLPEKIREALEEVEIKEIPDDIKEIYKEFKKALGKE